MKAFLALAASAAVQLIEAAAHPEITPGPSMELVRARQVASGAVDGFWSPYLNGSTTAYVTQNCEPGEYVEASSNLWGCCTPGGDACQPPLSCFSGTIYYPTFSVVCASTSSNPSYTRCGTYYLYSSYGDLNPLTHLYCAAPSDPPAYTLYIEEPTNAVTTTTVAPFQSNPTTASATASHGGSGSGGGGSKTNVGAIVGGVIGGLALLGIIALAVFLLFLRKRNHPAQQQQQQPPVSQQPVATIPPGAPGSPVVGYPSHTSYYDPGKGGHDMAAAAGGYMVQPGMEHQYQQPYGMQQPMGQHPVYTGAGSPVPSTGAYAPGGSPGQQQVVYTGSPGQQHGGFGTPVPVEIGGTEIRSGPASDGSVPGGVQEVQGTQVEHPRT